MLPQHCSVNSTILPQNAKPYLQRKDQFPTEETQADISKKHTLGDFQYHLDDRPEASHLDKINHPKEKTDTNSFELSCLIMVVFYLYLAGFSKLQHIGCLEGNISCIPHMTYKVKLHVRFLFHKIYFNDEKKFLVL